MLKHGRDYEGNPFADSKSDFLFDLRLDQWDDADARDIFITGMKRRVNEMIQTNNPGNLPEWAMSNFGQAALQFRTFSMAAHQKQLLHHLSYNDMRTYATFVLNSMFASLGRAFQVYLNSVGREDAQEYRDKYMSTKHLIGAAFERSAWGGIPSMTGMGDIVSLALTGSRLDSSRGTGLKKGTDGIPAVDLANRIHSFITKLPQRALDGDWQQQMMDARALMPLYNFPGLSHATRALAESLPDGE
jgi:hypothetical protein